MKSYRLFLSGWEKLSPESRARFVQTVLEFFPVSMIYDSGTYDKLTGVEVKILEVVTSGTINNLLELVFLSTSYMKLSGEPYVLITSASVDVVTANNQLT